MICQKCGRNLPDDKKTCIYCGESLDQQTVSENNISETDDSKSFSQKEDIESIKTTAIPNTIEMKKEDILYKEPAESTAHRGTKILEDPLEAGTYVENQADMTLDRALSLLKGMKDSFNNGHINESNYNKLVLEIIKDYILPMNDKEKINFVANGITDSELYEFLNEKIHNELKSFVITYVANK